VGLLSEAGETVASFYLTGRGATHVVPGSNEVAEPLLPARCIRYVLADPWHRGEPDPEAR
jgi:hypothetical protein